MRQVSDPVRFSYLKHMAMSPAHYRHALTTTISSDEINVGLAVHSLVLGGDRVAVYAGKRDVRVHAWAEFQYLNAGRIILKPEQFERAHAMANAVLCNEQAAKLIEGSELEVQIEWGRAGRTCSSRLDGWNKRAEYIFDLKTSRTAKPDWFQRIAIRMGYHAQMAWYLDAAAYHEVEAPMSAYLMVVESKPPYPVVVHELSERTLEAGRKCCSAWFEQLMQCEAADHWPGYTEAVVPFDVEDEEQELSFGEEDDG